MTPAMPFTIAGRAIDPSAPPFVIAEIGLNHGGSPARALALAEAAADAGASAIKLQTLDAAALVAADAPAPAHVAAASMVDFFRRFELDEAAHRAVVVRAHARGLAAIATPLFVEAVPMLARLGIDAFKIASGDVTYARLIRACGATGKPVVISTGMSSLDEAIRARRWALDAGAAGVALLHCVSAYPVPPGEEELSAIAVLRQACGDPVGLSDHAGDTRAFPVAIALGACLYERHLVLDADDGSIDAAVSSTPRQLAETVDRGLSAWRSLGGGRKQCGAAERPNLVPSRRALHARRALAAGHTIVPDDVIALRPATGLAAELEDALIGQVLTRDVAAGAPFVPADLAGTGEVSHVA